MGGREWIWVYDVEWMKFRDSLSIGVRGNGTSWILVSGLVLLAICWQRHREKELRLRKAWGEVMNPGLQGVACQYSVWPGCLEHDWQHASGSQSGVVWMGAVDVLFFPNGETAGCPRSTSNELPTINDKAEWSYALTDIKKHAVETQPNRQDWECSMEKE